MPDLGPVYEQGGSAAVIESLQGATDAEKVKAINGLMCGRYNDHKDFSAVLDLTATAEAIVGSSTDHDLLSAFKAVCFNRAAFFWPGWGDKVEADAAAVEDSSRYAERNLELAVSLEKGAVPTSRAEWLVGAWKLAQGDRVEAGEWFAKAFETGQSNDDELEKSMVRAYELVAKGQPGAAEILDSIDLAEDGEFYSGQVRTCAEAFGLQIK